MDTHRHNGGTPNEDRIVVSMTPDEALHIIEIMHTARVATCDLGITFAFVDGIERKLEGR